MTKINLSGFDTSSLEYITDLFIGSINRTYKNISYFNISLLRGIGTSFIKYISLISVNLPISKIVKYVYYLFAGRVSLTSLN